MLNPGANQTDTFTLRGTGALESYTPLFTYHGYRYVQVEGLRYEHTARLPYGRVHTHTALHIQG